MKYHKIRNIPLEVCTCEQKLAYNLAFVYADTFKKEYERMPMQFQKCNVLHECVRFCIKHWRNSPDYTNKYDIDAIFCALNAGIESYMKTNCPVLCTYEAIGKMFPAYYL